MKCINAACGYKKTKVLNTRKKLTVNYVLRRRVCPKCNLRYTSIEISEYFSYLNNQKT